MKKIILTILYIGVLSTLLVTFAFAEEFTPYSDKVFDILTASLSSSKTVTFNCVASENQKSIKITNCWLQRKNGTIWKKICNLDIPTTEAVNTISYSAYMNYSDKIGIGTYRVGFTINADGHTATRYSNERTFK